MWNGMHWGWDGMGWAGFGLAHLLWWALVIAGAVWLVRSLAGGRGPLREDRAESILRERYARGEISQEEYDERLRHLKA